MLLSSGYFLLLTKHYMRLQAYLAMHSIMRAMGSVGQKKVVGEHRCAMTTSVTSKVRTQPELAGTGATTHRAGNVRR